MFEALGPHAVFIVASYAAVAGVLGLLIAWLIFEGRAHQRGLEELEARGIRRRTARSSKS